MNIFKSKQQKQDDLKETIIREIKELGDMGVTEAIRGNSTIARIAIDRLDQIRIHTSEKDVNFAENEASKQIDRIRDKLT